MKKDIHSENYRLVVFKDTSCDYSFLTKSTVETSRLSLKQTRATETQIKNAIL